MIGLEVHKSFLVGNVLFSISPIQVFLSRLLPCSLGWSQAFYVAQNGLEFTVIALSLPPDCWDNRDAPPCPTFFFLTLRHFCYVAHPSLELTILQSLSQKQLKLQVCTGMPSTNSKYFYFNIVVFIYRSTFWVFC